MKLLNQTTLALSLALLCISAQAADTPAESAAPTATSTASTPSASERISTARAAIKAKNWKLALAELNSAVKDDPKNADIHNLLGYANRKQAQPNLPKAFEHYKMALQLDPKHKGAHE
jgi:Tfp pilus assembly protein PilF